MLKQLVVAPAILFVKIVPYQLCSEEISKHPPFHPPHFLVTVSKQQLESNRAASLIAFRVLGEAVPCRLFTVVMTMLHSIRTNIRPPFLFLSRYECDVIFGGSGYYLDSGKKMSRLCCAIFLHFVLLY